MTDSRGFYAAPVDTDEGRGARPPSSTELGSSPAPGYGLDMISCEGCGRAFTTTDGPGMLRAITGSCPDCGGSFRLDS